MRKVDIGSPAAAGETAKERVVAAFGETTFPMLAAILNRMPQAIVLPEVPGLSLAGCADLENCAGEFTIASLDELVRLAATVEQIAAINGYENGLTITDADAKAKADAEAEAAKAEAAAKEAADAKAKADAEAEAAAKKGSKK